LSASNTALKVIFCGNQICFSDSRFQNQNWFGELKIKIGFLNSNFKKGFCPGDSKAENGMGDATMRVRVWVQARRCAGAKGMGAKRARKSP
jgi:hypothetical protein